MKFDSNGKRILKISPTEAKTQVAKARRAKNIEIATSNIKTRLNNKIIHHAALLACAGKTQESADLMKKLMEANS